MKKAFNCFGKSRQCYHLQNWILSFFDNVKNKSFFDKLKSIHPTIEPWGTPEIIFPKLLCVLFMRTLCFRFLRYVNVNANAFKSNPYAAIFAIKRSWGMQSNVFERSVQTAPTRKFWSSFSRQFSIREVITCWVLYDFLYDEILGDKNFSVPYIICSLITCWCVLSAH